MFIKPFVVSVVTKIRILKQITTKNSSIMSANGCICSNKDKNFKANHNGNISFSLSASVVSVVTKIRNLKQITTGVNSFIGLTSLYL